MIEVKLDVPGETYISVLQALHWLESKMETKVAST